MTYLVALILGIHDQNYWFAACFYGFIGFMLYKYLTYNPNSKKSSPNTFSVAYWWSNNWVDVFGGMLIFFIWVRFKNEILESFSENPLVIWLKVFTDSVFIHMMFGVFSTHISKMLRKGVRKLKV